MKRSLVCGRRAPVVDACLLVAVVLAVLVTGVSGADPKQAAFERVFGKAARLDSATVAKVRSRHPNKRLFVDRDGDGRNDEFWYLDTDARHTIQPLLVRVIDEDGDLEKLGRPDRDSDLYVADFGADGTVDSMVDYQDNDGDGDADEMGVYFWQGSPEKGTLTVWWYRDTGDDNLMLYDVNWGYDQTLCQHRCHFSGDDLFACFRLSADGGRWIGRFENPFVFYDLDHDGASEAAIRYAAEADEVESIRYSMDADADAHGSWAYEYDFSITAFAEGLDLRSAKPRGRSNVRLDSNLCFVTKLRGIPTTGVLRPDAAREHARTTPWAKACLAWDEMKANTEANVERDPARRWEGVIAPGLPGSPQVGGPACSRLNKRYEITRPASPLRFYYDATDRRLHLLGTRAAEGALVIDYDLDGKPDAHYTYIDADRDGIFDRRQLDLDADGRPDFDWPMPGDGRRTVELDYESLSAFYKQSLHNTLADSQQFIDAARGALAGRASAADPVETFFLTKLDSWYPVEGLGRRMRSTPAGARLYVDLVRDRLLGTLKEHFGASAAWSEVESAYAAGHYARAAGVVATRLAPAAKATVAARFKTFTRRIPVQIDNRGGPWRDDWPVVLAVKQLQNAATDFNPDHCAVVGPDRWLDWWQIPHQVDEIDAAKGRDLSFLARVPPDSQSMWYVHYSPKGTRGSDFPRRTGTCAAWDSLHANIAWESTVAAYRNYGGHIEFFGKKTYDQSRKVEWLILPLRYSQFDKNANYHNELAWGMDVLHVNDTPGLGGLALVIDGHTREVRNPGCVGPIHFTKRAIVAGPVRAAVEVTATHILPEIPELTVRSVYVIYAEHRESEVRIKVDGGPADMLMSLGLTRLSPEETFLDKSLGCIGSWGMQDGRIGLIGMGLIVPPERFVDTVEGTDVRRLQCMDGDGELRYWMVGDWRRGRRFPVAPTVGTWAGEVKELAADLHRPPTVSVERAETTP